MTKATLYKPYRSYDVLSKWESPSWDETTREAVAKRLREVPSRSFFEEAEWHTLEAMTARLLPQPERGADAVPIVPWIDHKLARNKTEGYRYEKLPPMQEAWRRALRAIEDESEKRWGAAFAALPPEQQDLLLRAVQKDEVQSELWGDMSAAQFFESLLMADIVSVYYAHPSAWSEIGFGGPASPRGYVRLSADSADSWEAPLLHKGR